MTDGDVRDGVTLTNLDQPLFDGRGRDQARPGRLPRRGARAASSRQLRDRPLSVIRVLRGQAPFMQKNVPKYTPRLGRDGAAVGRIVQARGVLRAVQRPPTLLWLANQRAVEYHPTLFRIGEPDRPTHLVLDIDPPEADVVPAWPCGAAHLVRQALTDAGLAGAVKTSGAKGVHVFVPITGGDAEEAAAATPRDRRAGRAARPGAGDDRVHPRRARRQGVPRLDPRRRRDRGRDLQPATAGGHAGLVSPARGTSSTRSRRPTSRCTPRSTCSPARDPWVELMPGPQRLSAELIDEGRSIPIARVQAMHEGKRRARARRDTDSPPRDPECQAPA